jgi:hypothetical protein
MPVNNFHCTICIERQKKTEYGTIKNIARKTYYLALPF